LAGQIVHDDDVALSQFRDQNALDVSLKGASVDRAVEDERRDHASRRQASDESRRFPVAVRDADAESLAAGQRPCVRAMLVEAQVSSIKTSRRGDLT
jgi:hypothetical protein